MTEPVVTIVGGGLAGSEAAWQAAQQGVRVRLIEMRPVRMTPAHQTAELAELVCSNSFRGKQLTNAVGVLKAEMQLLGSLIMRAGRAAEVPAGAAMAVDRHVFSAAVSRAIYEHPLITIERREVRELPPVPAVIATGPLTSDALHAAIGHFTGQHRLAYYDAASPIVTAESIDWSKVFWASRYGKGEEAAYVNCPLTEEQYQRFYEALLSAEQHPRETFEDERYFEGCLPIEVMARRGRDTMRFGPLKPVGLIDPHTGRRPYAVVQLRRENAAGTLFNLVGFQTSLKWGEQKRVLRLIPGLEEAEFERFGVIHRNSFLKSPAVLLPTLQTRQEPQLFFAGQVTGVEGYLESAAGGLVAGINVARLCRGEEPLVFPADTAMGALCHYITEANPETFQPMNVAFGLLPPLARAPRDKVERKLAMAERALRSLRAFAAEHGLVIEADDQSDAGVGGGQ